MVARALLTKIQEREINDLEAAMSCKLNQIDENWVNEIQIERKDWEDRRKVFIQKQKDEYTYEAEQLRENPPLRFRPSTHFFRLAKVESEANKQKMFRLADENRMAKEAQWAKDKQNYDETRDLKISRNLNQLHHCHEQELESFDKKALARYHELINMRNSELAKHTKALNVKLLDMDNDHKKEVGKSQLQYEKYPATRPACDFNITAHHCHTRLHPDNINPEFSKISGCSNLTWRRDRRNDLNTTIQGKSKQNNTRRISAGKVLNRQRYQPTPLVSEFDDPFAASEYRHDQARQNQVRK